MRILDARLAGQERLLDITITDGRFSAIEPSPSARSGTEAAHAEEKIVPADGRLVTPQFVDPHLHLDYANTVGQPRDNASGTLFEGIQIWAEHKAAGLVNRDRVYSNALAAVRSEVAHGVGHIRTHVDTTEPGLIALEAILQLKADVADWCDIEIIAFPQNSLYGFPDAVTLLERALDRGADVVGGIPHLETSRELGVRQLETVFRLADKYGRRIDAHCDEIDDPDSRYLEVMAALSSAYGMEGEITSSHSVAMAYYPDAYVGKLLQKLVDVRMNFAVNPTENLHLQGRASHGPTPRGIAPVKRLLDAGINVAFGQDSIADPWYPIGEGALLRVLETGLQACHLLQPPYLDQCLELITTNGAINLGRRDYGIAVGNPADCLLLDATSGREAVQHQAGVLCSIHHGEVIFRQQPRSYIEAIPAFQG